jgi:L-alanine-DL-glutamate epimerase-like enolase superfamily enzyme
MKLSVHIEEWAIKKPFRISNKEWCSSRGIVVQLAGEGVVGRGEAQGVYYIGDTIETMLAQIDDVSDSIKSGVCREELLGLLPSGGARNAIDCALWDWEAKRAGRSIWQLTGIDPKPVATVFTIGLEETPEGMARNAKDAADCPMLKIKLGTDRPIERLQAIRAARPGATIVVDANQAWDFDLLQRVIPHAVDLNISMIEQPLPRGEDADLEGFVSPVPLAADESCMDTSEFAAASNRYDMINIKLDKTGGLTEALRLVAMARENDCRLMVGNMLGTSLSMAPSFVVAQLCDYVDIDGPLLLKNDHPDGLQYSNGVVEVFDSKFWG